MTDITEQLRVGFCTGISTVTLESAAKTIERLRSENEHLRKALAEKAVSQTMLRELSVGNRSINAAFEGGAAHLLADAFADQFLEKEATNYLEVHLHSAATGPLVVTLQRVNGKTPHQLRAESEKERDQLRSDLATAEQDSRQKQARIERLEKLEAAALNLVKMKGRHHTEIAYRRLVAALEESK